ncbi:MAG: DegT/DnrJ/EryC1/StrS family aminotransferase [Planctomycetota bacterium]|nr:MAG: DegT/DnrJ/EryC1/StrS family aminotransferase [Planctomycetota bacterium]
MTVPFLNLTRGRETYEPAFLKHVEEILSTGIFVLGPKTEEIENRLAERLGARHAIACSSGSDGLLLALIACGVKSKDEVITTPFTFFATASAITRLGATPVFADIDPKTLNLDPEKVAEKINPRTRAIIAVHLYGNPAHLSALGMLAKDHGLVLIEDAAQAIDARWEGKPVGAMCDAGMLSFYPTKNLSAMGDAGMVLTNVDSRAEMLRKLRIHGSGPNQYVHEYIGINARIDAFQAASLLAKLPLLTKWNETRIRFAESYNAKFKDLPLQIPRVLPAAEHVYHLYTIRTPRRDKLQKFLNGRGIGCCVYYPLPLHLQPCFASLGYEEGDFPEAELASREVLNLPCYPYLSDTEHEEVIEAVRDFFNSGGQSE